MATALKVPTIFTAIDKFSSVVLGMSKNANTFASKTQAAFARVERSARTFTNGVENVKNKIFNLHNTIGVLFAGMALRKGFEIVTNAADTADEIDKISGVIGISKTAFQELSFAAKRENVSNELLTGSFLKMNKAVGQLQQGSGSLKKFLEKNNPALLKQLKTTKSSEEAFNLLSGAVEKAPNAMQKAALAAAAFGKGGVEMIKLIEIGPAGIQKLRDEAQKLGIVMSDTMIADAAKFADANDNMQAALTGLKVTIASGLLPIMQKAIEKLTNWVVQNKDLIKAKTAEYFQKIADAGKWLYENLDTIVSVGTKVVKGLALIYVVSKLVEAGMLAMSIISGTLSAAMWLYTTAQVAAGTATSTSTAMTIAAEIAYGLYVAGVVVATAATTAFTAVLAFLTSPIALVIIAITALIATVVIIIRHWNEFGAAATIALGLVSAPLAFIISLVQSFRRNWEMVKMAFKTDGILGGLKAIGKTILDAILMPLQQVFHLLAKLPNSLGGGMFASAESKLQNFRTGLGVNTTTDESGQPLVKPAVNSKAAQQQGMVNAVQTNNQNKNVTIDFKNMPKGVETSGDGLSFLTPKTTSTLGF